MDHNTRTTTWQRPNTESINNWNNWQAWRNNRSMADMNNRFLFPQSAQPSTDNDPLGPLPDGWGMNVITFLKNLFFFLCVYICLSNIDNHFLLKSIVCLSLSLFEMNKCFLFAQFAQPSTDNDPLGPLPDGWGMYFDVKTDNMPMIRSVNVKIVGIV